MGAKGRHQHRRNPDENCGNPQYTGNGTFEEREEASIGLDHRGHEILLEHRPEDDPENAGCNRDVVLLHQEAEHAEYQHYGHAEGGIVDRERSHDTEYENARHEDLARDPQDGLGPFDGGPAQGKHDQVGENEDDEDGVDVLRVVDEDRRAWI